MKWVIVTVLLALLSLAAYPIVHYGMLYGSSPLEALLIPLFDGTTWAPGYSDEKFASIKPGMYESEVKTILGPPLFQGEYEKKRFWHYTTGRDGRVASSSESSTHQRIICFNQDGAVEETILSFYFD